MENDNDKKTDIQTKISDLVSQRQAQISELKKYYDSKNKKLYKDIILINLELFDELYNNKQELKQK
jgi:hypothetical protein